jgi:triacylglycerol lipase
MNKKKTALISLAIMLLLTVTFAMPSVLAAPTITTEPASNIGNTSATLKASFNVDDQSSVSVYFEIGNSKTSEKTYSSSGTHTETVTGLTPDTTYEYRAVLKYTTGWWFWRRTYTVYGEWQSFKTGGSTPPPPPPTGKNPILFVHGWNGRDSTWDTMKSRFRSAGWSSDLLYAYTFSSPGDSSSGSNAENAEEIQAWVRYILARTGASKVDLVSHSMGGLSTRYYVKFLDGYKYVDDYVSLGAPHHGTTLAYFTGGDMRPGSTLLNQLNSGDETPYGDIIEWTTVRSTSDGVVLPVDTAMLDGATNIRVSGINHLSLPTSSTVFSYTLEAVQDN